MKDEYAKAMRQDKMKIAQEIVDRVAAKGGRFLRFKGSVHEEVYVEIGLRAAEKCCQALRENREGRCKTPKQVLEMKRDLAKYATSASKETSFSVGRATDKDKPRKKKRKKDNRRKPPPVVGVASKNNSLWQIVVPINKQSSGGRLGDPMDESDASTLDATNVTQDINESSASAPSSGSDDDDSSSTGIASEYESASSEHYQHNGTPVHRLMIQHSDHPQNQNMHYQTAPSGWFCDFMNGGTCDPAAPSNRACFENLFRSLVQFKEVHGHCAIPPTAGSPHAGSSKEEREVARLADWASVQRCMGREVLAGRRYATEEEILRFQRLEKLGFVFDYEEWHWNKRYGELFRFQRGDAPVGKDHSDFSKCLGLALWIKEQRKLYLDGTKGKIHRMRVDRVAKLEKINFSWIAN